MLTHDEIAASVIAAAQGIVWDSDNTICLLPMSYLIPQIHAHQARLGLRQLTDEEATQVWRCHDAKRFFQLTGCEDTVWYESFNQHENLEVRCQAMTSFEGVVELIRHIESLGKQQYILTNTETRIAVAQLASIGLADLPLLALAGPPDLPRKPDPYGLYAVLHEMGLQPAEAVMIGDSIGDSCMAQRAGVSFLWWQEEGHHCEISAQIARAHITSYPSLRRQLQG